MPSTDFHREMLPSNVVFVPFHWTSKINLSTKVARGLYGSCFSTLVVLPTVLKRYKCDRLPHHRRRNPPCDSKRALLYASTPETRPVLVVSDSWHEVGNSQSRRKAPSVDMSTFCIYLFAFPTRISKTSRIALFKVSTGIPDVCVHGTTKTCVSLQYNVQCVPLSRPPRGSNETTTAPYECHMGVPQS